MALNPASHDLVVIGSVSAGQKAAIAAAKLGKKAAVIDRKEMVGGVCLHTGTIPSKTLREAILYLSGFRERSFYGKDYAVNREITVADLAFRVQKVMSKEMEVVRAQLARNHILTVHGRARFTDPHTVEVETLDGPAVLKGEHILIACGTRPAHNATVPLDGERIIDSDQLLQGKSLPRDLIVVGAGVIGLEYASMFAALGANVTLVEKRDRFLEFLDHEIVDELMHQMRKRGVIFRLGETVERLEVTDGPPKKAVLLLESGKRIVSDAVVFSAGRVGATKALNLGAAGLVADDRGRLKVDETFRTAAPHIFAAGDVIGYPSLAATSSEQGRLAACHAFGVPAGPMAQHFPIGIYAIPEVSMVGRTEYDLTREKVPYESGVARYREIARGQILGDDSGFFKMLFHRDGQRLLGVHTIGSGATELIHIGQAVLGLGGGLDYFLQTVFNYPTLAECYKVAALDAANKLAR
jgi:NAD(P) transhydrogenase